MLPLALQCLPIASAVVGADAGAGPDLPHQMQRFVLEIAVILIAARAGGIVFHRWLRMPEVIGELLAGVAIGPFALGALPIPQIGPLFPRLSGALLQVSPEIYAVATLGSLLLLFLSGLETDLGVFLRYFSVGTAVGIGGVVISFLAGAGFAWASGFADSWRSPPALFLGAVTTATSVGIAARILSVLRKTDSPEGVTILAAAVFDDVLGIAVLAIVMAMARSERDGASLAWSRIGALIAKTFIFWIVCTVGGILSARRISSLLKRLGSEETIAAFSLGLALLLSGVVEMAGLAMIIGAYIMGLSLSRTDLALVIRQRLHGAHNLLVPVFFCVMGMLIDLTVLRRVFWAGLLYAAVAIAAKVLGCGLPAWLSRFNLRGALRVGIGMAPRGEVALIIAGTALATGSVQSDIFGLAVVMTILAAIVTPPLMIRSFARGPGVKTAELALEDLRETRLDLVHPDLARLLLERIARVFRQEEFFVTPLGENPPVYQIRKDQMVFTLRLEEARVILSSPAPYADLGRLFVLEEVLALKEIAESLKKAQPAEALSEALAGTIFSRS